MQYSNSDAFDKATQSVLETAETFNNFPPLKHYHY